MPNAAPVLVWFRRDLRLSDHQALTAACAGGGPVIPVFVLDKETETLGAAPKWRLGLSIADLAQRLESLGSRLILRRGNALTVLRDLLHETGGRAVHWTRLYSPEAIARDKGVKSHLRSEGYEAHSYLGHLLHEPWEIETGAGNYYKVFTPYWRAASSREVSGPLAEIAAIPAPDTWPATERLADWSLGAEMNRGAEVVREHVRVGESAAHERLTTFLNGRIGKYAEDRDRPDRVATSGLSENLTYGEISPRAIWHACERASVDGGTGVETFRKELVWREFAWHLMWHTPHIVERSWRDGWERFPWRGDSADAERWRRGMTGEPMIDAGMRQLYVTGTMHNRVRMLVASYLTKHLMTHWKVGLDWFAECLVDWDPASNAMGWQWAAGSGPDAAPYFRIFNPQGQAEKFDPDGAYRHRFIAGFGDGKPSRDGLSFFRAAPRSWWIEPNDPYPTALIDLKEGRQVALSAYKKHTGG